MPPAATLRYPPPVRPGATIGIAAPAGPVDSARLRHGVARLRRLGYRVKLAANIAAETGYFAGTDAERAQALTNLWHDPTVDAIICARGGYGSMRLLPLLNIACLAAKPKFFCGYSDITALHLALGRAGLVTFHGEMLAAPGSLSPFNTQSLLTALHTDGALGPLPPRPAAERSPCCPEAHVTLVPGIAEGPLTGGNLTLISMLEGTPWALETAGRIVLLEDVTETPERVDRMLTHLLLAGKLRDAAGIVFGFSPTCEVDPDERQRSGPVGPNLLDVLADRLAPLGMPLVYGLPLGHGRYRATVPLGLAARLDADGGILTITAPALT